MALSLSQVGAGLGSLLTVNSLFTVILATRNSILALLLGMYIHYTVNPHVHNSYSTGIPFDRTVMLHRWQGRFTGIILVLHLGYVAPHSKIIIACHLFYRSFVIVKWALGGLSAGEVMKQFIEYETTPAKPLFGLIGGKML